MSRGEMRQRSGHVPQEFVRRDVGLLDPEKEMLALAARFISREFLDNEIFRPLFEAAADSGKLGRQKGSRVRGRMAEVCRTREIFTSRGAGQRTGTRSADRRD